MKIIKNESRAVGRIVDSGNLPPWYRGVVKFHVFPMFACGFDPIRRTKDDPVAASNHGIVKQNGMCSGEK